MKNRKFIPRNKLFQNSVLAYVLLMAAVFPLFCPSKYFNIQVDHLNFLTVVTLGLLLMSLISIPVYCHAASFHEGEIGAKITKGLKNLSITDYAFFAFLISAAVSTIFSTYPSQSFSGENGRLMGLSTYLLLFITYLLVSRGLKFKNYIMPALLIAADAACAIAIIQRAGGDIFGFYQGLPIATQLQFISTIGNIDFFSSYVVIAMSVSVCLYCFCDDKYKWFYLFSTFISFAALFVANADSGYVAAALMFIMIGIFSFKDLKTLKKFVAVIFSFFVSAKIVFLLLQLNKPALTSLKSIPLFLVSSNTTFLFMIIAAIPLVFLCYFDRKGNKFQKALKIIQRAFISIVVLLAAAVFFVFIYFSCIDTSKQIGSMGNYLRFNYQWGDNRGYIFSLAVGSFFKFNPFQKLFGYGMDMFKVVIGNLLNFKPSALSQFQAYDSAHDELLNYLVSVGIIGCASYIVFVISQIVKNIKNRDKQPLLLVFAVCFSCYFLQALANIDVPMVFPLFILLIAVSEAVNRELKSTEAAKVPVKQDAVKANSVKSTAAKVKTGRADSVSAGQVTAAPVAKEKNENENAGQTRKSSAANRKPNKTKRARKSSVKARQQG